MNLDKYKWLASNLEGQLVFRGVSSHVIKLHNDLIDALAIELDQQGRTQADQIWQEAIGLEANYREMRKELNEIQEEMSKLAIRKPRKPKQPIETQQK